MCTGCNQQRSAINSARTRSCSGDSTNYCVKILMQDLGMKCVVTKFVLQLLLPEQKEHCAAVANNLIQTATSEPDLLKKVITGDELWVYSYDLEMKAHSSQWKLHDSPCLKKAWQHHNNIKTMLTVCFDWEGACFEGD